MFPVDRPAGWNLQLLSDIGASWKWTEQLKKNIAKNSEGSQTIINGLSMNMLSDIGGLRTRKIAKKTLKSEESNKTIMGLLMLLLNMISRLSSLVLLFFISEPILHLFSWTTVKMVIFQAQCKTLRVSTRALWWSW